MATRSFWREYSLPAFPALKQDLETEVLIVGGGITGVTAAYLLAKEGIPTVLVERERCGGLNTGNTTAHLTQVTDRRLPALARDWGEEGAKLVWQAGQRAIDFIEQTVHREALACDFARVPGYLHLPVDTDSDADLKQDAELATTLGFAAEYLDAVPLMKRPGIRFANQAVFHPLKYLGGLARACQQGTARIYEKTTAQEFSELKDNRIQVAANGRGIVCRYLILATDPPLQGLKGLVGATLLQTKLAAYTSYAVGARIPLPASGPALYWDTSDPYFYTRIHRLGQDGYVILGGLDHKTGQDGADETVFDELQAKLLKLFPSATVDHPWSGQIQECHDHLPLIGETLPNQFVATGFSGNGLTFGTLAGLMAADAVLKRKNPWMELFQPTRGSLRHHLATYVRENWDFPKYLVADRFRSAESMEVAELRLGEGKIIQWEGQTVAAYRATDGHLSVLSPVCPHLGCQVSWNPVESSWDCPCHGSRFNPTGALLAGPAETDLSPADEPAQAPAVINETTAAPA